MTKFCLFNMLFSLPCKKFYWKYTRYILGLAHTLRRREDGFHEPYHVAMSLLLGGVPAWPGTISRTPRFLRDARDMGHVVAWYLDRINKTRSNAREMGAGWLVLICLNCCQWVT